MVASPSKDSAGPVCKSFDRDSNRDKVKGLDYYQKVMVMDLESSLQVECCIRNRYAGRGRFKWYCSGIVALARPVPADNGAHTWTNQ